MARFVKPYSKRRKDAEKEGKPDIYRYSGPFPPQLTNQIEHILGDMLGRGYDEESEKAWEEVEYVLQRELGIVSFSGKRERRPAAWAHFIQAQMYDSEPILDVVEQALSVAMRFEEASGRSPGGMSVSDAESLLNRYFQERRFGYRVERGLIIRIDTEFLHQEVVRPALGLLQKAGFEGAEEEFLRAHEHYRHGKGRDALVAAGCAFESACKTVLEARGVACGPKDTAAKLVDKVFENGLVEGYLRSHFSSFANMMKSGLPTMRNKSGGHGQGVSPEPPLPDYFVAFGLHQAAALVVFLQRSAEATV